LVIMLSLFSEINGFEVFNGRRPLNGT